MARTTDKDPSGDTPRTIEDKVRALSANQGINEDEMWKRIDKEVDEARKDGSLNPVDDQRDLHGKA